MTDQYAVFGNPISHSKSPRIHELFAEQTKQDIEYNKVCVEYRQFLSETKKFFANGGRGLNITVPFKLKAFDFAEQNGSVSERAKLAGAVNTLKNENGKIFGDNTDGVGLVRDIIRNRGWEIKGRRILILGAGGAVRGVLGPLLAENPLEVIIVNRTTTKALYLVNIFSRFGKVTLWLHKDPPEGKFDLIINGTSIGLTEEPSYLPSLLINRVHETTRAYDLVYGKESTPFLHLAKREGVKSENLADGLGMLVEQAAESFCLWRDVKYEQLDTKSVIEKVLSEL